MEGVFTEKGSGEDVPRLAAATMAPRRTARARSARRGANDARFTGRAAVVVMAAMSGARTCERRMKEAKKEKACQQISGDISKRRLFGRKPAAREAIARETSAERRETAAEAMRNPRERWTHRIPCTSRKV